MPTAEFEAVQIEKTSKVCPMCEDYARHNAGKPVVEMSCEGACLRGEVARISDFPGLIIRNADVQASGKFRGTSTDALHAFRHAFGH
jgi:hypothetical protein